MTPGGRFVALLAVGLAGASCEAVTGPATAVGFEVDAPLCSGVHFPLRFSIDAQDVGEDTLVDGDSSRAFGTNPGTHLIRAVFLSVPTARDTIVTLQAGERFTMKLDFYCS